MKPGIKQHPALVPLEDSVPLWSTPGGGPVSWFSIPHTTDMYESDKAGCTGGRDSFSRDHIGRGAW